MDPETRVFICRQAESQAAWAHPYRRLEVPQKFIVGKDGNTVARDDLLGRGPCKQIITSCRRQLGCCNLATRWLLRPADIARSRGCLGISPP